MKKKLVKQVTAAFEAAFGTEPKHIFLSPGRINVIGEHVDYNDGFVLPAAINKYICFAVSESGSSKSTIIAKDLGETYSFDINEELKPTQIMWANYILGVIHQLKGRSNALKGVNIVFSSTIPIGAGLSSSAALECGIGYMFSHIFGLGLSKEDIALIGQKSEHTFVGVNCGIMDQFASVFGKKNSVIKLDCNTLEYEYHKADFKEYSLLLLDSNVKHTHLTSGYNTRRQEVETGLTVLKEAYPGVKTFRDCNEQQVIAQREKLGETNFKRCLFVVQEIQRVLDAVDALEASNFAALGELMFATHDGLSKGYEVSCEEIDFLVDAVRNDNNVAGSRMMGGGFGGCSINLVKKGSEDALIDRVSTEYKAKFGITLTPYKIKISKGTTLYKQ
ncbi:galactokinase [Flavobacterium hauense]